MKILIIAYRNGAPIRLSDVAKVVSSAENVQLAAWANDRAAIILKRPAPAGGQRHRGGRPDQTAVAAAAGRPACLD